MSKEQYQVGTVARIVIADRNPVGRELKGTIVRIASRQRDVSWGWRHGYPFLVTVLVPTSSEWPTGAEFAIETQDLEPLDEGIAILYGADT